MEINKHFVKKSLKSCLVSHMAMTQTEDGPVFLHTHEMLSRDAVLPKTKLNLLLEVNNIQFGSHPSCASRPCASCLFPQPAWG